MNTFKTVAAITLLALAPSFVVAQGYGGAGFDDFSDNRQSSREDDGGGFPTTHVPRRPVVLNDSCPEELLNSRIFVSNGAGGYEARPVCLLLRD